MDCLTSEQIVAYLRGASVDARALESHVRDCPACGMELLFARETLRELRAKPATRRLPAKRSVPWIPWAVAAAALIAVLALAIATQKSPPPPAPIVKQPEKLQPRLPVVPEPPKPIEEPKKTPLPTPPPEPLKPREEPKPEAPTVKPLEPEKPAPPIPPAPKPVEEPKKAAPTLVERAVVARITHSIGGASLAVGRVIRAGETLVTTRQEAVAVSLEGYGNLYFRENSQVEIGASGEISLHEGEMLAKLDAGRKLPPLKTPAAVLEAQSSLFNVQATKTSSEISILDGRVMMASFPMNGPSTMIVKNGKAPEIRALDPGFASWLPEKLASKKFTGWFEAEAFDKLQGFKALPSDGASGKQAAVQIAEQGLLGLKTGLPFKGRHVVWLRVRQYEAKAALIGIHLNGQSAADVKLDWDGKPWRWVGPLVLTSDKLDLAVAALSRWPLKEGEGAAARSFPVVVDLALVTSDLKFVPGEKLGDDTRGLDLALDEPTK
jgi:hypothetical protein